MSATTTTHSVVTMNMRDGSVQGHAAGCADLKRGKAKFAEPSQAAYAEQVETKAQAWLNYNSDFLAEGGEDNAYEIEWLPCAKHVPAGDTHALYEAEFGDSTPKAYQTPEAVVVVRTGSKKTLITVNGEEVAYVANQFAEAAEAMVRASL